jgi:glycosyltransferase involved in cell wall biosynthesis
MSRNTLCASEISGGAKPLRIAFINTHPIQYFAPLYAYLNRTGNFDVTALYLSDFSIRGGMDPGFDRPVTWDIDLLAGYTPVFMADASRGDISGFFSKVAPDLWGAIRQANFDAVVINGHNLAAHHVALMAARSVNTPVFTRGETHPRLQRTAWRKLMRGPILKSWYKLFDGCLAIGSANARYYVQMGVPESKIWLMPYCVDNERYMSFANLTNNGRAEMRRRLGISSESPTVLYSAKFDKRKRPDDLINAFAHLRREGVNAELVLVGSGHMEEQLKNLARACGLEDVSFPGFINQAELPSVYAACDVFVLPSDNEPWGLAVNEAMCAGLPIVLSEEIGCVEDLVADGVNGATFNAGDVLGLAAALKPLLTDPVRRQQAAKASVERISGWSYRECAEGLDNAVRTARRRRGL